MSADRKALGTFVVAYPPKAGLRREDLQAADAFAELCAPVLDRRLAMGETTVSAPIQSQHA